MTFFPMKLYLEESYKMKSSTLKPPDNENGFTLVEILVSLIIILIMVMAIVPMYEVIAKTINSNKTRQVATGLANSALEEMRTLPYIVKDPDTGQVVTDPNVPQLGIQGGNPPGSLVADQDIVVDGITYILHTRVYWVAEGSNPTAYKKVKVSVESPNAFKGDVTVTSDFYTLATEEGEAQVFESGHIAVHIRDKDGSILSSPDIDVRIKSDTITESNDTEEGELLFGMVPAGNYIVSAQLPYGMVTRPDQVLNGGWIEQEVSVSKWSTENVYFDIDYPGKITVAFQHLDKTPIIGNGEIELHWKHEDSFSWSVVKDFKIEDYDTNNRLPETLFGNLWPGGYYSIKVNNLLDNKTMHIYNFDMEEEHDKDKIRLGTEAWNGAFATAGSTINLIIRLDNNNSLLEAFFILDPLNLGATVKYDYDDTNDVNRVVEWIDQSGKGNDLSPPNSDDKKPILRETENGIPFISFSGDKQILEFGKNYVAPKNNFTVFVVTRPAREIQMNSTNGEGQNWLMFPYFESSDPAGARPGLSVGTNAISGYDIGQGNKLQLTTKYNNAVGENFNLIALNYENRQASLFLNGGDPVSQASAPWSTDVYMSSIFGGGGKADNQYYDGDIAEIMVYDFSLDKNSMDLVSSHLMAKFKRQQ
jgi:prepilin-type N-terminal cleavage/methylation domain-containing protein